MKLYDIVSKAQYMQVFSIYLTNAYDQNIPIARGTRPEMISMDVDENEEDFFDCGSLQDIQKVRDKYGMHIR